MSAPRGRWRVGRWNLQAWYSDAAGSPAARSWRPAPSPGSARRLDRHVVVVERTLSPRPVRRGRPRHAGGAAQAHAGDLGRQRDHARVARPRDGAHQLLRRAHHHRSGVVLAHRRGPRLGSLGPLRLVAVRAHARRDARDRSRARLARALRSSRHAVAGGGARQAGGRHGRGHVRPAAARRYSSVTELRWNESDDASRRRAASRRARHRGQALGRAHPARHLSRLHRLHRRARGAEAAHRRRHGGHAGVRGSSRATVRSRPRSCRSAPTTRGSAITARRSRQ